MRRAAGLLGVLIALIGLSVIVSSAGGAGGAGGPDNGGAGGAGLPGSGEHVAVYLTTANLGKTMARQPDVKFGAAAAGGSDAITIDPSVRYQALSTGFGVAMTDTSAYLLTHDLPTRVRDALMARVFTRQGNGIGLSFLRVPVGGSDFIMGSPYTYDDMPAGQTDPDLRHFSIAHDRAYIIPMIRRAQVLNRRLTIMANPWTPPAWMKTDDKLVTTTGPLGTLNPIYYGVYADYLVRFLKAYQAAGIHVADLGVQNEPLTPLLLVAGIPESYLSPQDEGRLIHDNVAPALRAAGLKPRILAYDDAFQRSEAYIPPVMELASSDVGGLAFHCYLSDESSMSTEHSLYPGLPDLETECSSELSNIKPQQMAIRSLRNWATGVQLWNLALDQDDGPKIGRGCAGITPPNQGKQCIAPVTINTRTHTYSLTSDYWALAQLSRFIQLGARRIESSDPSSCPDSPASGWNCGPEDVAFQNPDGSRVLVVTSNDGQPHRITVTEGGHSFAYTVPDGATATFVWPAVGPRITALRLARTVHRGRVAIGRLTLSEPARVTLTIARRRTGRRVGGQCRATRRALRGHHRCVRFVRVRTLRVSGAAGLNHFRLRRRLLPAGRYRITARAVDAGGDRGRAVRRSFRVGAR
jgi:glucosylceramidase